MSTFDDDGELDARIKPLVASLEHIIKAHTDSLDPKSCLFVGITALAICFVKQVMTMHSTHKDRLGAILSYPWPQAIVMTETGKYGELN